MKTIKTVKINPVFVEFVPKPDDMNELDIYISKKYKVAVHVCLCGCRSQTVTPLGDSGWNISENDGKITIIPSISNAQFECKSHYIIIDNRANFV